jgi:hypothetical protein
MFSKANMTLLRLKNTGLRKKLSSHMFDYCHHLYIIFTSAGPSIIIFIIFSIKLVATCGPRTLGYKPVFQLVRNEYVMTEPFHMTVYLSE